MRDVLRTLRAPMCCALVAAGIAAPRPAGAEDTRAAGALQDVRLPGGLDAAAATLGDHAPADRAQFLLEFIRRTYNRPLTVQNQQRDALLKTFTAHLDKSRAAGAAADTLPLPLPPALWIDSVFGRRETPDTLVRAIAGSRSAALLYYGLLSLDDATRAWLETEPALVTELAARHAAAFSVAAPGLRVRDGGIVLPGGSGTAADWESIVGRRATEPAAFVRSLLAADEGRLSFFFASLAQLPPARLTLLLGGSGRSPGSDGALRRMQAIYRRVTSSWRIDDAVFWRPGLDPALLATSVAMDADGAPMLPRSRRFWAAVFAEADRGHAGTNGDRAADDATVDFPWLCEQVFAVERPEERRRYHLVLFASRLVPSLDATNRADAIEAVRASHTYPALIRALERARLTDVAAYAAVVRRAQKLAMAGHGRAARVMAQFQGALALLTRSALRGTTPPAALPELVSSLAAIDQTERGEYEGRVVRWLAAWLDAYMSRMPAAAELDVATAGPVERDLIAILSGPIEASPRFVEWEGTKYRLDFARAEAVRLVTLIGEPARPFLSSARALTTVADALVPKTVTAASLVAQAAALTQIGAAVELDRPESWPQEDVCGRYRDVSAALRRAAQAGDVRAAGRLVPALLLLADDLLARGLMEVTYAVALGHPDRATIGADEAAQRHEFLPRAGGLPGAMAWSLPSAGAVPGQGWRVAGSLLGIDVRLADLTLVPLSSRPPPRAPTLEDDRRRVLTETAVLVEPAALTDGDRDAIVAAMAKGRARLAGASTAAQALALADEIRLSATRRSLLPWVLAQQPERGSVFFSPLELFWLGLERAPVPAGLHAWGVSAEPRLGCLCLQIGEPEAWESLAGRWHSGLLASGFPDLNLRLAELLADLEMPASLLAPVLGAATLELVQLAASRDFDDRRALVEVVAALRRDRVEQYLALLTADGPLVPVHPGVQQ